MEEGNIVTLTTPWTEYRSVLLTIASHLKQNDNVREHFEGFFYGSIPSSSFDNPKVLHWLIKMEQSDLINIDKLDVLELFYNYMYEEMTDSEKTSTKILLQIREFQLRMWTIRRLTNDYPEMKKLLYKPPVHKYIFSVSKELSQLREQCRIRKRDSTYLSLIELIDIYSLATQRLEELRGIAGGDFRDLVHESIAVTDILMLELSESLKRMNNSELVKIFGWKILCHES